MESMLTMELATGPRNTVVARQASTSPIIQFRNAIQAAGLTPPDEIFADGKLHRFATNGKRGDDAGWYLLHGDGIPAGTFGCWRTGRVQHWRANLGLSLPPAEVEAHRAQALALQDAREAEDKRVRAKVADKAKAIWKACPPAPEDHGYLLRKGIRPHGARLYKGMLVIPMQTGDQLHSLQFIGPDGDKRFLKGGRVAGCYFSLGDPTRASALCIAEGFATGATIREATGHPVAVAFNAGNLVSVAQTMRKSFPDLPIIMCADDDRNTAGNPGLTQAKVAAQLVRGVVAVPDFGRAAA